jgi:co-chaperonin GroES (HSP10)|tara:strand:+ start:2618 stop:2986 length:369 start_codon:yes stop_codon:yes gene_type:complete
MSNVAPIDESATATQLPEPQGYRILCAIPDIEDKFDNGIIKTEETIKNEEILATVLFVVKLGTDCYKDESRFPSGPYCKEGDFVLVRPHTGTKINIHGKAFRLINDDSVEAVVDDPRGIQRQ